MRVSKIVPTTNGKGSNECEYRKMVERGRVSKLVPTSTGKRSSQCEYQEMVESGRIPGKGRIRASTEKLSGRVWVEGTISVTTEKW